MFWSKLTARGALAAMLTGFAGVAFFRFVVSMIPGDREHIEAVEEHEDSEQFTRPEREADQGR